MLPRDHQVLPISGAQHVEAFCDLCWDSLPVQCIKGASPTKALQRGLGNALQWVFVLPRPCTRAGGVLCNGCLSHHSPAVGPRQ